MKNVSLLFLCEALSRTASIVMLSSMALVGQRLTPNPALATFALGDDAPARGKGAGAIVQ